jgi:hypothetical protein
MHCGSARCQTLAELDLHTLSVQVKTARWADLSDESSDESDESEEGAAEAPLTQEQLEAGIASGMVTGLASSLEGGIDTDATLELRKSGGTSTQAATPQLFTVLEQQAAPPAEGLAAVGHTYRVPDGPGAAAGAAGGAARKRCAPAVWRSVAPA